MSTGPGIDVEQQWDDPDEEVPPPPPPPKQKCGCSKWWWAGLSFLLAVVVITPLMVTSIKQTNEEKANLANQIGDQATSPAYSPAMAPAVIGAGTDEGEDDVAAAPAMAAPAMVVDDVTAVPTIAPTTAPLTCGTDTELVCPANSTSGTADWVQVANDIVGEAAGDLSGFQISMSCDGSIVAVGAGQNDEKGDRAGHVRVYRYNSTAWEQLGLDIDGEAELDWFGYSVSLASDGLRMAVGARFNDGNAGNDTGSVRVYDYLESLGYWSQVGQDIDGEADGDQSGRAVSLNADGTRVAIGASANDGAGPDAGHVRVYELAGGTWTQLGQDIDGEATADRFGRSVAISADGTKVVVGAYTNDGGGDDSGHARVYELVSGNWTQIGQDLDGTAAGDWAGLTVAINSEGNRVVMGAPGQNERTLPGASQVYEFDTATGNWTQLGDALVGGYAVSMSEDGDRVAAGDYKGRTTGTNAGLVNVYEYDGNDWVLLGTEISGVEGELSGTSVALSADGQRVAVSSPVYADESLGEEVGATRVYDLCS